METINLVKIYKIGPSYVMVLKVGQLVTEHKLDCLSGLCEMIKIFNFNRGQVLKAVK